MNYKKLISFVILGSFLFTAVGQDYLFAPRLRSGRMVSVVEPFALRAPEAKKTAGLEKAIKGLEMKKIRNKESYIIRKIREKVLEEMPHIRKLYTIKKYLTEPEMELLRNEFYKITKGHFEIWGLAGTLVKNEVPYFNGSYKEALIISFPELNLERLGFGYEWSSEAQGIASIHYAIKKERPDLWDKYQKLNSLTKPKIKLLRNEFYKITTGHFGVWGLQVALHKSVAPYFKGSYKEALIISFPELELKKEGFKRDDYKIDKNIVGDAILLSILSMIPVLIGVSLIAIKRYLPIVLGESGIVITVFSLSLMKVSNSPPWSIDNVGKTATKIQSLPHYLLTSL